MAATPQNRTSRPRKRALAPASSGHTCGVTRRGRASLACHGIPAERRGDRRNSFALRTSRQRTVSPGNVGIVVAIRLEFAAAQGPAGGFSESSLAGRNHDPEKPHAQPGHHAFHRVRTRRREAVGGTPAVSRTSRKCRGKKLPDDMTSADATAARDFFYFATPVPGT